MRTTLLIALNLILLNTCVQAQESGKEEAFHFYEHSRLQWEPERPAHRRFSIEEGDALVFAYTSNNAGEPGNHSVAPTGIYIEIPSDTSGFVYTEETLDENKVIYIQFCYCMDVGIQPMHKGTIKGRKLPNGNWELTFDLNFLGRRTSYVYASSVTHVFTPTER